MVILKKEIRLKGSKGEETLEILIDSGTTYSCIKPKLEEKAIIGAVTLQKWRIKLDFEHNRVILDSRVTDLKII